MIFVGLWLEWFVLTGLLRRAASELLPNEFDDQRAELFQSLLKTKALDTSNLIDGQSSKNGWVKNQSIVTAVVYNRRNCEEGRSRAR